MATTEVNTNNQDIGGTSCMPQRGNHTKKPLGKTFEGVDEVFKGQPLLCENGRGGIYCDETATIYISELLGHAYNE